MKILIVSFAVWIFVVPTAVALFLFFTFLAAQIPDLYFSLTSLTLGFSISAMAWGPFWLEPVSHVTFRLFRKFQQPTNQNQEKNYGKCLEGQARF